MKKILMMVISFIFLFGVTGCKKNGVIDKVSLTVKDGTLTNKGVTLILKNDSNVDYSYGLSYYIEQQVDGEWKILETIHDVAFNLPAYELGSLEFIELNIDWEYGYGQLESGRYRIVKEIFKVSTTEIKNNVEFNVYAEFEINEDDFEYEKATETEVELKTELETMNHGNSSEEFVKYNVYIENNKLYAKNLNTNEEKIIFDKELVKSIAKRNICCAGNANLLILTNNGNVYMSRDDCNYGFSFDTKFDKLDGKDIVSLKLIPVSDYDFVMDLYGIDTKNNKVLLHKMN